MDFLQKLKRKQMIKINKISSVIFLLILSMLLTYASFSGGSSEAYLFPKLLSSIMIILSSFSLIIYFYNKDEKIAEINIKKLSTYLCSLVIFIVIWRILRFLFFNSIDIFNYMLFLFRK